MHDKKSGGLLAGGCLILGAVLALLLSKLSLGGVARLILRAVLIAVIAGWNGVKDFKTASFETYLFLVVVNWFDGFVIDLLWVGHSKIWRIEGMEGVPYGKPWRTVYTKRSAATALYLLVAAAVGGIVVLIGKI